jgi:rhodanese-related sulfurtransferase
MAARRCTMFFRSNGCKNIGPEELDEMMRSGKDFLLLDVRTPQENRAQAIEGTYLLPLQELGYRIQELPRDREIVVYCHVGNRSAYACSYLSRLGYKVKNLEGGIVQWNMSGIASMAQA